MKKLLLMSLLFVTTASYSQWADVSAIYLEIGTGPFRWGATFQTDRDKFDSIYVERSAVDPSPGDISSDEKTLFLYDKVKTFGDTLRLPGIGKYYIGSTYFNINDTVKAYMTMMDGKQYIRIDNDDPKYKCYIRLVYGTLDNKEINQNNSIAYPNPTSQFITLPYTLNGANAGVMNVYNLNGQVIETFNLDTTFENIVLDVSNYPSGMYRYGVVVNGVEATSSFVKE